MDFPKGLHLLIDADIVAYRCGFAAEKTYYCVTYGPNEVKNANLFETAKDADTYIKEYGHAIINPIKWSRKEVQPLENALQIVKTSLETLLQQTEPSGVSLFLSGEGNFRETVAKTKPYKGNRDNAHKPKHLEDIKDYLCSQWNAQVVNGIEADDALGMRQTPKTAIVSIDKDLKQIPGWHWHFANHVGEYVTPKQADFTFWTQVLTGDSTDNVPGLAGTGPVAASKILDGAKSRAELFERVWAAYLEKYKTPSAAWEYFNEQAALVYILRKENDRWEAPYTPAELLP